MRSLNRAHRSNGCVLREPNYGTEKPKGSYRAVTPHPQPNSNLNLNSSMKNSASAQPLNDALSGNNKGKEFFREDVLKDPPPSLDNSFAA